MLVLVLLGMMRGICFVCVDFFFFFISPPLLLLPTMFDIGGLLESFD